jgi:hypothetical protein
LEPVFFIHENEGNRRMTIEPKPWKRPPAKGGRADEKMGLELDTWTLFDTGLELPPNNLPVPADIRGPATSEPSDPRRQLPIVVRRENEHLYRLMVASMLWASVEWSGSRGAWCVEDSRNRCLAHVEGILGDRGSLNAAIRLAKEMIRDGRMPTPEEVKRQMEEGRQHIQG